MNTNAVVHGTVRGMLVNRGDKVVIDIDGGSMTQIDDGNPARLTCAAP